MPEPLVSVLIPTIGRLARTRTIGSLLEQDYPYWEAIIVANNLPSLYSPDLPVDPRLSVIDAGTLPNDTGASARNIAFQHAHGEYIATLDDDDWWETDFLLQMVRELERGHADLVYCRTWLWSRDATKRYGAWFKPFDADMLPKANYILSPSILFRREMLEGYTLRAHSDGRGSDWRFYVDRLRAGFRFAGLDHTMANLRVDEGIWRKWAPRGFSEVKP